MLVRPCEDQLFKYEYFVCHRIMKFFGWPEVGLTNHTTSKEDHQYNVNVLRYENRRIVLLLRKGNRHFVPRYMDHYKRFTSESKTKAV